MFNLFSIWNHGEKRINIMFEFPVRACACCTRSAIKRGQFAHVELDAGTQFVGHAQCNAVKTNRRSRTHTCTCFAFPHTLSVMFDSNVN